MRRIRYAAVFAAALGVALAAASVAHAKTKRFRPLDFAAGNSASDYSRSPLAVFAETGPISFYAPLGLPYGATLTAIRFFSYGGAAYREAQVVKHRPSAGPPQTMAEASKSTANLGATPDPVAGTVSPSAATVEPGYLYEVVVTCFPGTGAMAVDVDYTP